MLSEQQICKIVCSNPPACTCTDNCPIRFTIESVHKAVEAQHKADLEDFEKQKQEMWDQLCELLEANEEDITDLDTLKETWGLV